MCPEVCEMVSAAPPRCARGRKSMLGSYARRVLMTGGAVVLMAGVVGGSGGTAMAAKIAADDPPTISVNDVVVVEPVTGTAKAVFTVTLSAASATPVSVK